MILRWARGNAAAAPRNLAGAGALHSGGRRTTVCLARLVPACSGSRHNPFYATPKLCAICRGQRACAQRNQHSAYTWGWSFPVQGDSARLPVLIKASVTSGALRVLGREVPLPIR